MGKKREIYEMNGKNYLKCPCCGELKEMTDVFWHKSPNTTNGYISRCKECISKKQKEYYAVNADRKREQSNTYRAENIDKIKKYREETKEHIREHGYEYRKNNAHYKEYMKRYEQEHKDEILARKKKKIQEMGYGALHLKTARAIKKLGIRPDVCPICGEKTRVEAHHPDYNKRNEIIFACNKCHQRIHNGWIECPKNIIDINK